MAELSKTQIAALKSLMPAITLYNKDPRTNKTIVGLQILSVLSKNKDYRKILGLNLSPTTGDVRGVEPPKTPSQKPTKQSNKESDKEELDDDKQSSDETNIETDKDENKQNDVSDEQVSSIHNHINSISDENQLKLIRQKIVDELQDKEKTNE